MIKLRSKTLLALGVGLGYLAGSPQGRAQTQKWVEHLKRMRNDPATRQNVDEAVKTVKDQTTKLAEKVSGATHTPDDGESPMSGRDMGAGI